MHTLLKSLQHVDGFLAAAGHHQQLARSRLQQQAWSEAMDILASQGLRVQPKDLHSMHHCLKRDDAAMPCIA